MRVESLMLIVTVAVGGLCACSDSGNKPNDGGTSFAGDGGGTLRSFSAPADPGPSGVLFAASGEVLALAGYPFPPNPADAPAFVDGWAVRFTRLLTTFDKVTLSSNPDVSPGDQSLTGPPPGSVGGGLVAEIDGPWAVDLARDDPTHNVQGKGDPGVQAVPIAQLKNQNKNGNQAFATDGTRYAFGFKVVRATTDAFNVNLDTEALADYQQMVQDGCSVLYAGTATFNGGPSCTTSGAPSSYANTEYASWPTTVNFHLCFKSPSSYVNCQNPDNDPAAALPGEESLRGIAFSASQSVLAQVTIHTDHPFWDSVIHESPAHFDQFAARVLGQRDGGVPTVTLEMTQGVDFTAYTDALGNALYWRYCVPPPTDAHDQFSGAMMFDRQQVPRAPAGESASAGLRDYYDFATYNQSTQGHLNADGLCAVIHDYESPN